MQDYLSRDIGLGIQGVAMKSGAAKKLKEDQEMFMDIMNRSMPPGIKPVTRERIEMPSGFKIGNTPADLYARSLLGVGQPHGDGSHLARSRGIANGLSKAEIYARMGIDGDKELEIDWDQVDHEGTAKTRIELADKMFDVLQKDKNKIEYRQAILNDRLQQVGYYGGNETVQKAAGDRPKVSANAPVGQPKLNRTASSRSGGKLRNSAQNPVNSELFDSLKPQKEYPGGEMPWTHISVDRNNYATHYGITPNRLPYQDEVDMMHEDRDRYQELNHWYSSLEKPNEDNIDVLKRINRDRIAQLSQAYQQKRQEDYLNDPNSQRAYELGEKKSKAAIYERTNKEVNNEKQQYKDKFKQYLHNKEKRNHRSGSPEQYDSALEFDRYQCTSPNPKYVSKHNNVYFKDNIRIDPSGMTQKELERLKMESDPTYISQRQRARIAASKTEEEKDEEAMLHWIWNKVNPTYRSNVTKQELLQFLLGDQEVKEVFSLKDYELAHIIEAISTEQPGLVNFDEFENDMNKNQSPERHKRNTKEVILSQDLVSLLRENFEKLDRFEDMVVPRAQLIQAIRDDVRIKKFMNRGVVFLPKVNKEIALRKVLHQIEQEEFIKADHLDGGDSNFVSSKKYISWNGFMDYFTNYNRNTQVNDPDLDFKKDEADDQNIIELPKLLKEQMRFLFNQMKDEDGFVKSIEFLDRLKQDSIVIANLEVQARSKAKNGEIPSENLREALNRIENTIDSFVDWEEFFQYFTRRGVPLSVELSKRVPQLTHVVAPINSIKDSLGMGLTTEKVANFSRGLSSNQIGANQPAGTGSAYGNVQNLSPNNQGSGGSPSIPIIGQGNYGLPLIVGATFTNPSSQGYPGSNDQQPRGTDSNNGLGNQGYGKPYAKEAKIDPYGKTNPYEKTNMGPSTMPQGNDQTQLFNRVTFKDVPLDDSGATVKMPLQLQTAPAGYNNSGMQQQDNYQQSNPGLRGNNTSQQYGPSQDQYNQYGRQTQSQRSVRGDEFDDPYVIDDFVVYGDNEKLHKITIPSGLKFEAREERRAQSVKGRKFKEYMQQKRRDDDEAIRFRFRANSVPRAVREPQYDRIMSEQEQRRAEVKKNSIAITRANENPFSFYERDKNKPKKVKEDFSFKPQHFKAQEVPWFCSTELYARESDFKENQRQERINRRAQELMATSKLPPRMEKYQQQRKQNIILGEQRAKIDWDDECTFRPPEAKRMPDFERAHRHFQLLLDKKRSHKKPTQPLPFQFEANKKIPVIHYLENDNALVKQEKEIQMMRQKNEDNLHRMRDTAGTDGSFVPNGTRAFTAKVNDTKKRRDQQAAKQAVKLKEQQQRDKRMTDAAVKVRMTLAMEQAEKERVQEELKNKNNPDGLPSKTKKQEFQETTSRYQMKLKEINTKLESRPPVFQTYSESAAKKDRIVQMKMLLEMEEINKKNKVNIETHLTPEQLNLLKDARLLRKMGKI